jgi:RNA polymerase sigma factor (sigma-70 family)
VTRASRARLPQDRLIEKHLYLARKCAAAAYRRLPKHPFEDLLAAAHVGLVQAARTFDPKRGVPFEAFARCRVAGEILDSHRRLHKTQYVNEFPPDPVDTSDWFKGTADSQLAKAIRPALLKLNDVELEIVKLRYHRNLTFCEIAGLVGLSEGRVAQIHKRSLVKMRETASRIVR